MPNSTQQSLLQSMFSETLSLATAVGELRARFHHVSHRLDLLERQQSELAAGMVALKTPADDIVPPILKHGRRYLPQILTWLGEKMLPYLIPGLGIALTFGRKVLQALWEWLLVGWHWLLG